MANQELPDFSDPGTKATLELQFRELEEGRSITPTEIRHTLVEPIAEVTEVHNAFQYKSSKLGRLLTRLAGSARLKK